MADQRRPRQTGDGPAGPADRAGTMMREAAEAAHTRILDDPHLPEQPSGARHLIYFTVVMVGAFVLNVVVLMVLGR